MDKDTMTRKAFLLALLYCVSMTEAGKMPISFKRMASATSRPDPAPPTTTSGCEFKGKIYPPGARFGEGYNAKENWCFGNICSSSGQRIAWDNFNCKTTSAPSTTPPPPPTTPPPQACTYNGKQFPINSDIDSGYDEASDWCYGAYCNENAEVLQWDKFNCKRSSTTSTIPTTSPTSTTPANKFGPFSGNNSSFYMKLLKFLGLHKLFGKKALLST